MVQIVEEGGGDAVRDAAGADDDDDGAAERMPLRVQFADDVDVEDGRQWSGGRDASTSIKDVVVPLQPLTSDDGYLTSPTRTTAAADLSYLSLIDSPTDTTAAASFSTTGDPRALSSSDRLIVE